MALPHRGAGFNADALFRTRKRRMIGRMSPRDPINALCAALPGAEVSDPWGGGHDCWKVGGRMFASLGARRDGVSVKTDSVETAQMLIDTRIAERAPYMHRSWVYLPPETALDELRHRIATSYRLIRAQLPKRVQAGLAPLPEPPFSP